MVRRSWRFPWSSRVPGGSDRLVCGNNLFKEIASFRQPAAVVRFVVACRFGDAAYDRNDLRRISRFFIPQRSRTFMACSGVLDRIRFGYCLHVLLLAA